MDDPLYQVATRRLNGTEPISPKGKLPGCTLLLLLLMIGQATGRSVVAHEPQANKAPEERQQQDRPHLVLINLDDADRDMFRPEILRQRFPAIDSLARNGISFTNFHVTSPLCGPSRASLLRGQYAHAIDHRTNVASRTATRGFEGDLESFVRQGYFDHDLGTWMQDAGYHTIFVGKHINAGQSKKRVPAGWNDYHQSLGSRYYETFRFTNRKNPDGSHERLPAGVYRTDAEADDVVELIHQRAKADRPLFVYFAPFGPHGEGQAPGGMIDLRDQADWQDIQQPIDLDFNEADVSDKPDCYQQLAPLKNRLKKRLKNLYRDRMLAVRAVDRAIQRIIAALESHQMLDNTYLFITSDNGFCLGQHRLIGKGNSFSRSSHVPLIVHGPGIARGTQAAHLLGHIDLVPTLLDLAGSSPQDFHDGKSFASLLTQPDSVPAPQWRDSLLIENWQSRRFLGQELGTTFCQLRLFDALYTEFADGSREYYDLNNDPLELENMYDRLPEKTRESLSRQLKATRHPQLLPIVTIEELPQTDLSSERFPLRGLAEDSSGVRQVKLVIFHNDRHVYWNGSGWQAERYQVTAQLKNPSGIQSEWTCPVHGPRSQAEDLTIILSVVANNGKSARKVVQFSGPNSVSAATRKSSLDPLRNLESRVATRSRKRSRVSPRRGTSRPPDSSRPRGSERLAYEIRPGLPEYKLAFRIKKNPPPSAPRDRFPLPPTWRLHSTPPPWSRRVFGRSRQRGGRQSNS